MTGMLAAALVCVAACAASPPAGNADGPEPSGERVEGVVRVAGSAPVDVHILLEPTDGGDAVRLAGALAEEIARVSGARVVAWGEIGASDHPVASRQMAVSDYEIVSIGGEPVIQGTIVGRTAGWVVLRTRDGRTLYLTSVPDSMRTGDRVWVRGQDALVVQGYGVLRPR